MLFQSSDCIFGFVLFSADFELEPVSFLDDFVESVMHGFQFFLEVIDHCAFYFDGVLVFHDLTLDFGHLVFGVFLMDFESFDDPVSGMDIADQILDFSIQLCSLLIMAV